MPVQHTLQPLPDLRYRLVHATAQRLLNVLQFRLQSLPRRLSSDREIALFGGSTAMRKPQKREALRFPFPPRPAIPCGAWSELDHPRLLRMQFQSELRQPFPKLFQEPAPCGVPTFVSDHSPSSLTPAFNHFWIRRCMRLSATRCWMKRIVHS